MKWRRVPPVYSPIKPASFPRATAVALGLLSSRTADLSAEISSAFGARETVPTDSGTSALVMALRVAVPPGAIVAFPGYACIDIIAAAIRAPVRVSLYDVDPHTLGPDLDSLRQVLAAGAVAVVVTPLFGYPPDMSGVVQLTTERGVPLIEDAAQGAGGVLRGKRLGAFGDVSVLSFGRGKGTTGGSGGALLVRRPDLLDAVRLARAQLRAPARGARQIVTLAAQWMLARPALYSLPASIPALQLGEMVYHAAAEPRALSLASAAVVRVALSMDAAEIRTRQKHAAQLISASAQSQRFAPIRPQSDAIPGYLRLALLDTTGTADADPSLGAVRGYPITLDQHPETRRVLVNRTPSLPGAGTLRDRLFTLATHSRVTARDIARLATWLGSNAPGRVDQTRVNE